MNGDHSVRVVARELFRYRAAPVAAMGAESPVPELLGHQASPEIVDAKNRSVLRRSVGETVARKIGHDNVEGIFRPPAEGRRVGEHRNNFQETIKRIGIAMRQYERERLGTAPARLL